MKEKAKSESPIVGELLTLWVDDKTTGVKKLRSATIDGLKTYSNYFKKAFGMLRIKEINSDTIEDFLKSKNVSARSKKNYALYLQNFFNWAIHKKLHDENPAEYWVKQIHVNKTMVMFYTVDQVKEIMIAALKPENKSVCAYFALGLFAGIRPDELNYLTWKDNVILKTRNIFVQADISKNKADRMFKMSDTLYAWLNHCKDEKLLIPNSNLRKLKLKVTSGLSFKTINDGMRHTFATFYYAEVKNYETVRSVMGNSPSVVQRHYKGTISSDEVEGFKAITPEELLKC
jgi:integrase